MNYYELLIIRQRCYHYYGHVRGKTIDSKIDLWYGIAVYGCYLIIGERCDNFTKYFKISRCAGGCLNDRELVFGRGQKGPGTAQTMVSAVFVDSGLVDSSGIAASDNHMDNK